MTRLARDQDDFSVSGNGSRRQGGERGERGEEAGKTSPEPWETR